MTRYNVMEELAKLKLTGMSTEYQKQSETPLVAGLSFDDRFQRLVEAEANKRLDRRTTRLLHGAKVFEPGADLADIDFDPDRKLDRQYLANIGTMQWAENGENILIIGATGTGKTHIASAITNGACHRGYTAACYRMTPLLLSIGDARGNGTYRSKLKELAKPAILVLDDFGLRSLDKEFCIDFLEVVEERVRRKKTFIITSQLPVRMWPDCFEHRTVADGFMDRVVRNAHRIMLSGKSRRPSVEFKPEWAEYGQGDGSDAGQKPAGN